LEPYFITLVSWGRGVPHVSVTHTPLATVSIFNKFLNLKNFSHPHPKGRGLWFALSEILEYANKEDAERAIRCSKEINEFLLNLTKLK